MIVAAGATVALALVVGQSIETWLDYLRGGYETASAYAVIETPARQAFFLVFVLMVTPGIGVVGVEGVMSVIVLAKLLIERSAYRAATGGIGRLTAWLTGPEPLQTESVPDIGFCCLSLVRSWRRLSISAHGRVNHHTISFSPTATCTSATSRSSGCSDSLERSGPELSIRRIDGWPSGINPQNPLSHSSGIVGRRTVRVPELSC